MTTASGRHTLSTIEAALADLRREEADLHQQLAAAGDAIAARRSDEAEALRDLARFRLRSDSAGIAERLDQASRTAREAMAAREQALAGLGRERAARAAEVAAAETALAALGAQLDAVEERIQVLEAPLAAALAADARHRELEAAATARAGTAEAAAAKAAQAEADRTAKGRAYEDDPLFTYLWERGFGTAAYAGRGLTRLLDRWVARLIGFAEARAAYAVLTGIPPRLRAHAERVEQEAEVAADAVDVSADRTLARLAGEDLAGRAAELGTQVAGRDAALAPLRESLAALDERVAAYGEGRDEEFRKATEALSRSLAGDDLQRLREHSLRTPEPQDERLVELLERARADLERLEAEQQGLREKVAAISRRRSELTDVSRDFRDRGWHHGGNSFDLGDLLAGYALGRLGRGDVWGRLERTHRSTGGSGSSSIGGALGGVLGGGLRGGRSMGGGGFSGGRSIGGGGFRTGRRF